MDLNPVADDVTRTMRRTAQWIAGFVMGFGALTLLAWQSGWGERLSFGRSQVPTAPGTGVLCLLVGAALLAGRPGPRGNAPTRLSRGLAAAGLLLALAFIYSQATGVDLAFERWLSGTEDVRNGVHIGRSSLYTALLFAMVLAAVALPIHGWYRVAQSALLSLVYAASLVLLQGYLLGAPLLYDGTAIPVAAPTAALLHLCSVAAALFLGPDTWPLRVLLPRSRPGVLPNPGGFVWLALLLAGIVITSGYFWYRGERLRNEQRAIATLATIATLKAREVSNWYRGHRATAVALSARLQSAEGVVRKARSANAAERRAIRDWLTAVQRESGFARVELFDAQRRSVTFVGSSDEGLAADLQQQVASLPISDSLVVQDLYRGSAYQRMTFWAPLPETPGLHGRAGAWVALAVDAEDALFPLLRELPYSFRTGEFVLWRVEDDSLRLISDVARDSQRSLRLVVAKTDSSTLAVRAFRSGGGDFAGADYRGVVARGSVRAIPGTPWYLVAKVDEAEIREPVLRSALRATVLSLLFLIGVAGFIYALWYRRDLMRTERELALVADRERGIAELQRNEARYARAMRGTSDGLWDWDIRTGEVFVSPRWRRIVGADERDDIVSAGQMLQYFEAEDVTRHERVLARHLEFGEPYDLEMQLRPRAGEGPRWIRTRGEAERDERGRAIRMGGAITDITRRRLTESSLRRSERVLRVRGAVNRALVRAEIEEELFQVICEIAVQQGGYRMAWVGLKIDDAQQSVLPVAVAGEERGYLRENPVSWGDNERGQGPTGRSIRTGLPQVAQDLLAERDYAPWREAARARGYQSSLSIPLVIGNEVIGGFMLYAVEPNAFDEAELALAAELGRDISFGVAALREHRVAMEQREQLSLFRQVINRSADAIFVADVETGLFVDFNDASLQQLGYTADELRRLGPDAVVVDLSARGGLKAVAAGVRAAGGVIRPSIHRRKDGAEVPVEVALSVVETGQRTLMLGVARDVSERIQALNEREELQAQLTRAQKMESVGRLAGGVAHDFNNLLTVITSSADLALGELPAEHPLRRDLLEIKGAGERAARLTRQLLAFSRQQVLKREVLNLNEVVTKFLAMLSRVIGEDVHVELRLGPEVPPTLADAGQLEQVLMNLCVNARDAMPRGGTLTIGTGVVVVDEEHAARREGMTPGDYVTLSVTDTGTGMDRATQAKIFEPFFTTKEQGRGTGLGLSTVYGVVKQSGGSIWCYSEVGRGTTFRIYLPVTKEAAEEQSTTPSRRALTGKETILVVEDEESIRFVARRVLERSGYTVLEADSGAAALALLATHEGPLDLVLTDLVMPGMTGIELAQELRKSRPTMKMLFTSGYSADVVSDRFHPDADWNFISKPYGVRELAQEVRRVLDGG